MISSSHPNLIVKPLASMFHPWCSLCVLPFAQTFAVRVPSPFLSGNQIYEDFQTFFLCQIFVYLVEHPFFFFYSIFSMIILYSSRFCLFLHSSFGFVLIQELYQFLIILHRLFWFRARGFIFKIYLVLRVSLSRRIFRF